MIKRIDRIISEQTNYSRKEIKKMISSGVVYVDEIQIKNSDSKFDESSICIKINGEEISIRNHIYLLLNKPKGYISTTDTRIANNILSLVPEKYKTRLLFPSGRLDKDTTGLILITDDGEFVHNILSPKKHVKKVYEVLIDIPITLEMIDCFKKGVTLNDGICKPANLEIIEEYKAKVTISEGKYHQIKRMFGCYGAKVIELNRICIGNLELPNDLNIGDIREATREEIDLIKG